MMASLLQRLKELRRVRCRGEQRQRRGGQVPLGLELGTLETQRDGGRRIHVS